jgi:hypothetical protein
MAHSSKRKSRLPDTQIASSHGIGAVVQRLAVRAARHVLRFLWRQIVWWIWIGGIALGGYLIVMHTHYTWIGGIMFCIAFGVAICWFMDLIHYEDGGDYSDRPARPRESSLERQQKEVQEDIDRYQREQEDRER